VLVQPNDPTLTDIRRRGAPRRSQFQCVEVAKLFLNSESGGGRNRDRIQLVTIGSEPYNGMQRAYGNSATSTWS
jgi:hypothetical protein